MLAIRAFNKYRATLLGALTILIASCDDSAALDPGDASDYRAEEPSVELVSPVELASPVELDTTLESELDPAASFGTETTPRVKLEIGVCLEDIEVDDDDDDGVQKAILDAEAYCLAKCKGTKPYWVASEDLFEIGDDDAEDDCEEEAEIFCEDNFGRRLKDSCFGLPKDDL